MNGLQPVPGFDPASVTQTVNKMDHRRNRTGAFGLDEALSHIGSTMRQTALCLCLG